MEKTFLNRFLKTTPLLCALMVVGIHSFSADTKAPKSLNTIVQSIFSHGIFTAAVPIFFIISGYLFYRNAENISDIAKKQKKRLISYLLPFVSWSLLYYIVFALFSKAGISAVTVDLSVLGIVKGVVFYEYVFPLWFLFQLLIYTILSPVIFYILTNKPLTYIILIITAVLGVLDITVKVNIGSDTRSIFSPNYFTYYFTGALLSQNKEWFLKAEEKLKKLSTALIVILLLLFGTAEGIIYDLVPVFNKRILVPFVAFFAFILFDKISVKFENSKIKLDKISTMAIYGIHSLIITIITRVLNLFHLPGLLLYFAVFCGTAVISVLAGIIFKKIKILNLAFCGGRK